MDVAIPTTWKSLFFLRKINFFLTFWNGIINSAQLFGYILIFIRKRSGFFDSEFIFRDLAYGTFWCHTDGQMDDLPVADLQNRRSVDPSNSHTYRLAICVGQLDRSSLLPLPTGRRYGFGRTLGFLNLWKLTVRLSQYRELRNLAVGNRFRRNRKDENCSDAISRVCIYIKEFRLTFRVEVKSASFFSPRLK